MRRGLATLFCLESWYLRTLRATPPDLVACCKAASGFGLSIAIHSLASANHVGMHACRFTRDELERGSGGLIEDEVTSPLQLLPSESVELNPAAPGRREQDRLDAMPWLPCTITLQLPVPHFTIADLMELAAGSVIETACHHTSDVPLRVNDLLIGWTEFDVIEDRLAVRITDQA